MNCSMIWFVLVSIPKRKRYSNRGWRTSSFFSMRKTMNSITNSKTRQQQAGKFLRWLREHLDIPKKFASVITKLGRCYTHRRDCLVMVMRLSFAIRPGSSGILLPWRGSNCHFRASGLSFKQRWMYLWKDPGNQTWSCTGDSQEWKITEEQIKRTNVTTKLFFRTDLFFSREVIQTFTRSEKNWEDCCVSRLCRL